MTSPTRDLAPFEQAVIALAAVLLGFLIGYAYARIPEPTAARAAPVRDLCAPECERGCLPPEACR